ncbi:epoxyqueuosine reductase [Zongyangia hominis]|uniref:Epoxyqueuosine reductase n=1 Tax=Zongyangia hominis TaxID=2763677 RepID=A0A926I7N5_9FIRM|nr:QueG-associated DUF1730 domain-containing protein [Zongyangia hominis]MBC8571319.1 epoxyqueuosine reductase [Zongyangia hominis]
MFLVIDDVFRQAGIPAWGSARLDDCGPVLPCRGAGLLGAEHQSVLCCLFPYDIGELPARNLSRYACVPDYHRVAGGMLREAAQKLKEMLPDHDFLPFVDSSPVREVRAAALAGLGCVGKNGLLITPDYGSFVFLGEIVTDLPLGNAVAAPPACIGCNRCVRDCPTGAIREEGGLHKSRCLSEITQKRGELTPEEEALIAASGILWGCDRCQEVCPMNKGRKLTPIVAFYKDIVTRIDASVTGSKIRGRAFGFRGVGVLKRNARILDGKKADTKVAEE